MILIGQGGHSRVIRDTILATEGLQLLGYLDDKFQSLSMASDGLYAGPIQSVWELIERIHGVKFVIAIGNNPIRKRIYESLQLADEYYLPLVHKSAYISKSAKIGAGTVVMANAVINAEAKVGKHAIINTGAIVEHDNIVEDFVHLSPNVTLTGAVKVGEGAHLGASATLIPNVKIGEWSIIGAGATVIHDIPAYSTAIGVPAKVKEKESSQFKVI